MRRRQSRRRLVFSLLTTLCAPSFAAAAETAATPAPAPEPGEKVSLGVLLDDRPTVVDPTAHYTLYLPTSYRPDKLQPVLLIFDPRGRARLAAELFREGAERFGWILVSSNDTRSDTTDEPNMKAINALGPELQRFAVDPRRVYATGFSGGGILAWWLGERTRGLAGVISVGSRLADNSAENLSFVHWGAAGDVDFNYDETKHLDEVVARQGVPHWVEIFHGPHSWFPPELATQSIGWMELQAMRRGLREKDPAIVEALWREWSDEAVRLESTDPLAAQRRYAQLAESFDGLRDVAEAKKEAARLDGDKRVKAARREERKWDALDDRYARVTAPQLTRAGSRDEPLAADELRELLELPRLLAQAKRPGYEGVASQRMLRRVDVQAAFYLPRELRDRGNYPAAATVLEIALQIDDTRHWIWYDLACARALSGETKLALAALEQAVAHGFKDAEGMKKDDDLASLRDLEAFQALVARAAPAGAGAAG